MSLLGVVRQAQAKPGDEAAARTLFGDGRRLADDGEYVAARAKFEAASKLFSSAGVLMNLGDCYEHLGLTASAWNAFGQAASVASRTDRADDAVEAERRRSELWPRLTWIAIRVKGDVPGLTITRDGGSVEPPAWGAAIAVDPGSHVIRAEAAGHQAWSTFVVVATPGQTANVDVPELTLQRGPSGPSPVSPPLDAAPLSVATSSVISGYVGAALGATATTLESLASDFAVHSASDSGPALGFGAGVLVSSVGIGAGARGLLMSTLKLWELDAEVVFHVPAAPVAPYFGMRGGYVLGSTTVTAPALAPAPTPAATTEAGVHGFNIGLVVGLDYRVTKAVSVGIDINAEFIDVERPPLPLPSQIKPSTLTSQQNALYQQSGLTIGFAFTPAAHVSLHF